MLRIGRLASGGRFVSSGESATMVSGTETRMMEASHLAKVLRALGVEPGDLLLVHSSLRRLGPVEGGADAVIDALFSAVGPDGTVAVPTHTFAVVHGGQPVFHASLTPSNVGALTNVFRLRPGAVRSLHPTHSVAATGPRAEAFTEGHERDTSPCPPAGPYGRLHDWGGKILIIGPGLECCTFFHGCEERAQMPWAFRKTPITLYTITADGTVLPIVMHRHYVNTWDRYPQLERHLEKAGALRRGRVGACDLRLLDARTAGDWLVDRLKRDPRIILPARMPRDE